MGNINSASRLRLFALLIFVLSLSVELRAEVGLSVLISELAFILLFFSSFVFSGYKLDGRLLSPVAFWVGILFLSLIFAYTYSDEEKRTITYIRNFIMFLVPVFVLSNEPLRDSDVTILLRAFVVAAIVMSLIGVWQSVYGISNAPSLFSMGLERDDLTRLQWVMEWKLNNLHSSGLYRWQKSLAHGLHVFTNNYGEYLVYSIIAVSALWAGDKISTSLYVLISSLFLYAVFLSASRTSLLGMLLVLLYYYISNAKRRYVQYLLVFLFFSSLLVIAANLSSISLISYDSLKTINGRSDLNSAALESIKSAGVMNLLFGGGIGEYYEDGEQSPHMALLFMLLNYGLVSTVLFYAMIVHIFITLYKRYSLSSGVEKKQIEAAMVAIGWFLLYGLTWSVVESAYSNLLIAFFVGVGLSRGRARVRVRYQGQGSIQCV